ncbi:hypothetical protein HPB51_015105 [Rhipicephalus microplus]|uniref:Uncharacterized protein n=1 Tax=Rhipicephalus microplus TaxID=6941 RepID=A0A9J6EU01_RHIMP|nr:hypothetical protein HPB51_015105 [Rhipicephalus microplus]
MNTSLKSSTTECRKFAPNIFNKSKCQNCFRTKDAHSAEALESNRSVPKTFPLPSEMQPPQPGFDPATCGSAVEYFSQDRPPRRDAWQHLEVVMMIDDEDQYRNIRSVTTRYDGVLWRLSRPPAVADLVGECEYLYARVVRDTSSGTIIVRGGC